MRMKESFSMKVVIDFIDTPLLYEKLLACDSPRKRAMLFRKLAEMACQDDMDDAVLQRPAVAQRAPRYNVAPSPSNELAPRTVSTRSQDPRATHNQPNERRAAPPAPAITPDVTPSSDAKFDLADPDVADQLSAFF